MRTISSPLGVQGELIRYLCDCLFCLPVTFLLGPWVPYLPSQGRNHKLVGPLTFPVCLPLRLLLISDSTTGHGLFHLQFESAQPPQAVVLLVLHGLPCSIRTTVSNDGRKKGSRSLQGSHRFHGYFLKFNSFSLVLLTLL